uniref:Ion_trans_2 domain-containing protein n=1 Tax=Panagrellus redivivus TaxID=6233 RepID=A0A7E4W067_PANRE
AKGHLERLMTNVCEKNSSPNCNANLQELLKYHQYLSKIGYLSQIDRFDIFGSFFYSGTVISTIGFGMSTPRTTQGKVATVAYGILGCTCCVLFFNLFLERFITAMTYFLRYIHEMKVQRRNRAAATSVGDGANKITLIINDADYGDSASSVDGKTDQWRPSVYKVFLCIFTICMGVIFTSAMVYSYAEQWPYSDALYFCFTSFATIGFGDLVSNTENTATIDTEVYRIINFVLLTFGASLVYCLFNISSIVVKQVVNWLIKKMDIKLENPVLCCGKRKKTRYMGLGLRPPPGFPGFDFSERSSVDSTNDGLLSLKEFLMYNHQSSLVLLQKQFIKSAYRTEAGTTEDNEKISATRVGPMGILSEKFGDE